MRIRSMVWLTACLVAGSAGAQLQVAPTAETDGVRGAGDVSGLAFWASPAQPAQSLILLADRSNGLSVLGFDGRERQFLAGVVPSVDVHDGFRFGTVSVPLVAAAANLGLSLFTVVSQPDGGAQLQTVTPSAAVANVSNVKLYASSDGRFFVFVGNELGQFQQFELTGQPDGGITVTPGRTLSVPGAARALAIDEAAPALFIAQQSGQLWRFDPDPAAADAGTPLDLDGGSLGADVQGLALYAGEGGAGSLVAVSGSTGNTTFTVLERQPPHALRGTFAIVADGGIDGVEASRALAISSARLADAGYPTGVLLALDGANAGGAQNAKLVSWSALAQAFTPPLAGAAPDAGDGGTADGGSGDGGTGSLPPSGGGVVPEDTDDGPACSCASSSVPGAALLGLLGVLLSRRRRRDASGG